MKKIPEHHTKIVCTIGPASDASPILERLLISGMDIARVNLAHGTEEEQRERVGRIRRAGNVVNKRVAILADLPGPKLRIGTLAAPLELKAGQEVVLAPESSANASEGTIPLDIPPLTGALREGDPVFLNDGFIVMRVQTIDAHGIHCLVKTGGTLLSHKGVNLPSAGIAGGAFTTRDRELLGFAMKLGVDAIGLSFVEGADDIAAARDAASVWGEVPFIVAKIERREAWKHINEILDAADGLMVARGDLGVEVPIEQIAIIQKRLIHKARAACKPVITATQMLESMVSNSRPTRAEVTDVANAILDGTDCVMLSEESAVGLYPLEATEMLVRIASVTEGARAIQPLPVAEDEHGNTHGVLAREVNDASTRVHPVCVATQTESGRWARQLASFRPSAWILAITSNPRTAQRLCFTYGVQALWKEPETDFQWEAYAARWMADRGVHRGTVILTRNTADSGELRITGLEDIEKS